MVPTLPKFLPIYLADIQAAWLNASLSVTPVARCLERAGLQENVGRDS